jgi:hypothetical protein
MESIKLCCITALIIMVLYMFQNRYEFINESGDLVSIGNKWTGCVGYAYLDWGEIKWEC